MKQLRIDLQAGFSNDTVKIRIDNHEVFQKEGVSTDYSIGRADSVEAEVKEGDLTVEVSLPKKNLSKAIEISKAAYLKVSVQNGEIVLDPSNEMPLYF